MTRKQRPDAEALAAARELARLRDEIDALGPDGRDVAALGRLVADLRAATVRD